LTPCGSGYAPPLCRLTLCLKRNGSGNSILKLRGGIKFRLDQAQTRSIAVPN
jgi:hypothetical protein